LKTALTKLQHDYDESLAKCTQLTQTLDAEREEHLNAIAILKNQQQTEFDNNLKQLQDENDRIKFQIEYQKSIETLKSELENTRNEQLSALETELQTTAKTSQDKITELTSQISKHQEELNDLQQLLAEQTNKSNQYEEELKEKSSQIAQLEQFKSQSNSSQQQLINEYNSLKEEHQQTIESIQQKTEQFTSLQEDFDVTTKQLQNQITQLTTTIKEHEQFRQTIETTQSNDRQSLEEKDKTVLQFIFSGFSKGLQT
jgi:chromosome segregation ATPase